MSFHIQRNNIRTLSLSPSFSDNAHLSIVLKSGKNSIFFFTVIDFIFLNKKNEKGTIVKQG